MISTHILDTSAGSPAAGVPVRLEKRSGDAWVVVGEEKTNSDGRISFACPAEGGTYVLRFDTKSYFGKDAFFPDVPVVFHIVDTNRKYHVPLLLNPFGYSTYRGS